MALDSDILSQDGQVIRANPVTSPNTSGPAKLPVNFITKADGVTAVDFATSAFQTTGNTSLASIDGKVNGISTIAAATGNKTDSASTDDTSPWSQVALLKRLAISNDTQEADLQTLIAAQGGIIAGVSKFSFSPPYDGAQAIQGVALLDTSGNYRPHIASADFGSYTDTAVASSDTASVSYLAQFKRLQAKVPTIGQKTLAGSLSVGIASDQVVQTNMPDLLITSAAGFGGTQTVGNNVLLATSGTAGIDALGYRWLSIQANCSTGTYTAGTFVFEGSNDNSRWAPLTLQTSGSDQSIGLLNMSNTQFASGVTVAFFGPLPYRYFRARTSAAITGTNTGIQFVTMLRAFAPSATNQQVTVAGNVVLGGGSTGISGITAGANLIADVGIGVRSAASGAPTQVRVVSTAATTTGVLIASGAHRLYKLTLYNADTSPRFLKLYVKASAPTVGTDIPKVTIALPAGALVDIDYPTGTAYALGLAYGITGGIADTDATAVTAGQVTGEILYA